MKKKVVKSPEKTTAPSFEEALERLETIVHNLEEGQAGLEESLAEYESGVKLLRHCYHLLSRAERRIELLSKVNEDGSPITEPFGEEDGETLSEKAASRSRRRTARPSRDVSSEVPDAPHDKADYPLDSPDEPEEGMDDTPLLF